MRKTVVLGMLMLAAGCWGGDIKVDKVDVNNPQINGNTVTSNSPDTSTNKSPTTSGPDQTGSTTTTQVAIPIQPQGLRRHLLHLSYRRSSWVNGIAIMTKAH